MTMFPHCPSKRLFDSPKQALIMRFLFLAWMSFNCLIFGSGSVPNIASTVAVAGATSKTDHSQTSTIDTPATDLKSRIAAKGMASLSREELEWIEKIYATDNYILFCVASAYLDADSAVRNRERAVALLKTLAGKNHAPAQYLLSKCHEHGWGTAKDAKQAFLLCKRAAESGMISAQSDLAGYYAVGHGIPQNSAMCVYWTKKAAEQGDAACQYALGEMYRTGLMGARDYEKALFWYQQSALQGYAEAQCALGLRYAHGQGVDKNIPQACAWLVLAVQSGSDRAKNILDTMLEQNMTPERVQEVRALVIKYRSQILQE